MNKKILILFTVHCLLFTYLRAEDVEVKLPSNDGTTKFAVQDSDAENVATIDSDGNLIINGDATIKGGILKRIVNSSYLKLFGGTDSSGGGFIEAYGSGEATNPGVLKLGFGGGATTGNIQFLHYDGSGWTEKLRLFPSGGLFLGSSPSDPGYGTFKTTFGINASTGIFSSDVTISGNLKSTGIGLNISTNTILGGSLRFYSSSTDLANPVAGEVYYNSSTNRLRLYNGKWVDIATGTITGGGNITGNGSINSVAKFTGTSAIGDSNISDSGSLITLTGASAGYSVDDGAVYINNSNPTGNRTILGLATGGTPKFRFDNDGDLEVENNLFLTGITKGMYYGSTISDPGVYYDTYRVRVSTVLRVDGELQLGENIIQDSGSNTRLTLATAVSGATIINSDLQINGDDILDSGGTTRITLGVTNSISDDLEVAGGDLYLTASSNNRKLYWDSTNGGITISTRTIINGQEIVNGVSNEDVLKINKTATGGGAGIVITNQGTGAGIYMDETGDGAPNHIIAKTGEADKFIVDNDGSVGIEGNIYDITGNTVTINDSLLIEGNAQFGTTTASTISSSGYMDLADLNADPTGADGRICYRSDTGKLRLYTSGKWVNIATGTITGGGLSGSGTADTVVKFMDASTMGDSNITDNGSLVTVGSSAKVSGQLTVTSSITVQGSKFSVGSSTLVVTDGKVGIGGVSPLVKLDIRGDNTKSTTADEKLLKVASRGTGPLALDFGIRTNATASSRYAYIDVLDDATPRALTLQRSGGYVGIGKVLPGGMLHISTGPAISALILDCESTDTGDYTGAEFRVHSAGTANRKGALFFERTDTYGRGSIHLATNNTADSSNVSLSDARLTVKSDGKVGIRTTNPAYDLDVNGDIRAIGSVYYGGTVGNADGELYDKPDYVFQDGYKVLETEEVEQFLKREGHLPWMTSVKQEKEENGNAVNMTRMAFETVETVENLQLQIIKLNKFITQQRKEIDILKAEISRLKK